MMMSGSIIGTGDVLAQQVIERKGYNHNLRRTTKMICIGMFFTAPTLRASWILLDKVFKGTTKTTALKKMLAEQIYYPTTYLAVFFTVSEFVDGKSYDEIKHRLE